MSIFFPGNDNREARVRQLITQTTTIQSSFVDTEDLIRKKSDDTYKLLDRISKTAGYPTTEAYIAAGRNALTPAQKANYENMMSTLLKHNSALKTSMTVSGVVGAIGFTLKVGVPKIVSITCKISAFVHGMQGVLRGLVLMFKGAFQIGWDTVRTFVTMIKINWGRSLVVGANVGSDITQTVSTSMKWIGRAGKFLQWAGVIAEVGMMIYQGVEGEKQRDKLRNAIIETCSTRFGVKKIQMLLNQTLQWNSKLSGVVSVYDFYIAKMEEQKIDPPDNPAFLITQADVDKEVQKSINKLTDAFDTDLAACNPDDKVLGALVLLDKSQSSGEVAWTNEDPTPDQMKQWIAEHPLKDDQGNVVPIEGPAFEEVGLKWTSTPELRASQASTIDFIGTNTSGKGQRFSQLQISIPIASAAVAGEIKPLFYGTKFGKKGATGVTDGTVTVKGEGGATGIGDNFTVAYSADDKTIKVKVLPTADQAIALPVNGSIKFSVQATKAGLAGTSIVLAYEEWFRYGTKNWVDIIVKKI